MLSKLKSFIPKRRMSDLWELIRDFLKKCNDDHVASYSAMSTFFILLSFFPFMILLLSMATYLPFTKEDIQTILTEFLSFENNSMIIGAINEVYRKTTTSVFTVSIVGVLWSSSKGIYAIVKGLNSVFDIEDNRNYFVLRFFSILYTILFMFVLITMLIMWVFGNQLYRYISERFPFMESFLAFFINRRTLATILVLVFIFMLIYHFIPNRSSSFLRQFPGAIVAAVGWILTSRICSIYIDNFSNFTYIYGSMAGITILLIWLYFCMSMVFYGAEFNFFLENKKNYHTLIRIMRPNFRELRRQKEQEMKEETKRKKKKS